MPQLRHGVDTVPPGFASLLSLLLLSLEQSLSWWWDGRLVVEHVVACNWDCRCEDGRSYNSIAMVSSVPDVANAVGDGRLTGEGGVDGRHKDAWIREVRA